jgi:hypothetical protein
MSSTTVSIPGVGDVDFPSSMSDEEISNAAHGLYENQFSANPPAVPKPQINMQETAGSQSLNLPRPGGLGPGMENNSPEENKQLLEAGAGGLALGGAAAAGAPLAVPVARWVEANPVKAYLITKALGELGLGKHADKVIHTISTAGGE